MAFSHGEDMTALKQWYFRIFLPAAGGCSVIN